MSKAFKPPAWIDTIIRHLAPENLAEEISGDLYEIFLKDFAQHGETFARGKYAVNAMGFIFKSFFWKRSSSSNTNLIIMLNSYFKMATRSLLAYKGITIINILGLVIGIASALVIFTVIRFELSFDTFHTNTENIYRMVRVSGPDKSEYRTGISYPVPVAMKEEIASLENIASVEYFGGAYVDVLDPSGSTLRKFREEAGVALIEPTFFKVFDFRNTDFAWIEGNPERALIEPFSVVLTRTMAKKYFGDRQVIGQTLQFQRKYTCKVTGVVEDFPANTDFPFTILISYSTIPHLTYRDRMSDWFSVNDTHHTYIVTPSGISRKEMEEQIAKVHATHTPKELHESRHYLLQELGDMHFDARFGTFSRRTISRETLLGLGIVAVFLLLTASINYINLSTAQSTLRAKEIGLRKVMGGSRGSLMWQFFIETFVVVCFAGILALGLSEMLLNNLQTLLNLRSDSYNFSDPVVLVSLLTVIGVITILSGFYPSLIISRFNPVTALKNNFSTVNFRGISLRKVLVVVQFTITQILVVGTFIVVNQMQYFRNVDMGFNQEAIITTRVPVRELNKLQAVENQLRAQTCVSDVSFSYTLPSGVNRNHSYADIGKPEASAMKDFTVYEYVSIDSSFLGLYGIKLLAGRNLTLQDSHSHILINKTLLKNLGMGSPEEAIGKELKTSGGNKFTVAGVIDDYYSNSLKEGVDNIVMFAQPENYAAISIKLNVNDGAFTLQEAVKGVEKIWNTAFPDFIFNYQFLDDNIATFYAQEQKYAQLFQLFSLIFILIGSLGLYGLMTFVVNRKGKEVAVRKVLGATITNIVFMFSREYIQLIVLSFVIAVPAARYFVDRWLRNFENHIPLEWWLFVVPGVVVLCIALLVISSKSIRAAGANPVDKLKYE